MHNAIKKGNFYLSAFIIILLASFIGYAYAQTNYIIDTDVGADDMVALLYMLRQPSVRVLAIAVDGNGNAHCVAGAENVEKILALTGNSKIPIGCGPSQPWSGGHFFPEPVRQNADNLLANYHAVHIPAYKIKHGEHLLKMSIQKSKGNVHILAIGSATLLADLLRDNPSIVSKISEVDLMAGAVNIPGNLFPVIVTDNTYAEWNVYLDPAAMKSLFRSGVKIRLIPLDVSAKMHNDHNFMFSLLRQPSKYAKFLSVIAGQQGNLFNLSNELGWDPLAAVIATNPDIAVCHWKHLRVIAEKGKHQGQIQLYARGPLIDVCFAVNQAKYQKLLFSGIYH